jgi:hypothetical protein
MPKKTEKLKKPPRGKNGGARPGSGRKALAETPIVQELKVLIDNHGKDLVELATKNGVVKKARVLILLDKLFVDGYGGNIQAIKEYLDRVLGKAVQPISGPDKDKPLSINIAVDSTIANKYALNTGPKDTGGGPPSLPGIELRAQVWQNNPRSGGDQRAGAVAT